MWFPFLLYGSVGLIFLKKIRYFVKGMFFYNVTARAFFKHALGRSFMIGYKHNAPQPIDLFGYCENAGKGREFFHK